jgi:PAS domain S-box-containing protein
MLDLDQSHAFEATRLSAGLDHIETLLAPDGNTAEFDVAAARHIVGRLKKDVAAAHRARIEAETKARRYRRDIEARPFTRAALNRFSQGYFVTDRDGYCLYVNRRGAALLGASLRECLGRDWRFSLHPDDREPVGARWETVKDSNRRFDAACRIGSARDRFRPVRVEIVPDRNSDGEIIGYSGTIIDDTVAEETAAALRQKLARARGGNTAARCARTPACRRHHC